jgi:DNA-binding XRE family transcriptional regulator
MTDFPELYAELGRKIREAREREQPRLSQDKLAKRLKISRASMVNIEAGRQHAPLHVLWQIAEELHSDLALLIPRKDEVLVSGRHVTLDAAVTKQIEEAAAGNPETVNLLTAFVAKWKNTVDTKRPTRKSK